MDLTQLRYLVAVAEQGNMTRAARSLNTSQPTISAAVRNLEEDLGTTLFNRGSKGVTLTAAGRALVDMARQIFELIDRTRSQISDLESELVGDFTLGCNEALGTYFLPRFMNRFLAAAPGIRVSIWNASSPRVRDAVLDRTVDFGVVVNPEPHPDLVMRTLFRDALQVFVAAEEGPANSLAAARARIRTGPLIASRRIGPVQDILNRLDSDGGLPARVLDCGDLHLVRSLAVSGLGVSVLPRRVALMRPGELVPLHAGLPGYPDVISLLFRGDIHRTQAALALKDALVEYGEELKDGDPPEGAIVPA